MEAGGDGGEGRPAWRARRAIDEAADRFEAALAAGDEPDVLSYVASADPIVRQDLLRELIATEAQFRRDRGDAIVPAEYALRFPELSAEELVSLVGRGPVRLSHAAYNARNLPREGDRNLLFGVLALQADLVSREQLVAAMTAWAAEKHTPIGNILVRQGALGDDARALIEALVGKQVDRHGGDPSAGLTAISSVSPLVREVLAAVPDWDVRASLLAVRSGGQGSPIARAIPGRDEAGRRYRVLRLHAKGGLGTIYLARDAEVGRDVALKEIQDWAAADPDARARFMLEAEVTGNLEHPGVVPLYGLGSYADGRPFYAMRFVKGDSLKEALVRFHSPEGRARPISERNLEFRDLLRRFVDVCNAVAYAHSRGVLHRDLKPGNVMLGKYGETLLVDWGLAKVVGRPDAAASADGDATLRPSSGSGATPTRAGGTVGTPGYMSPEQAEGRLEALGPASDVYGLGATLYHILTGRPPVEGGDAAEVLRKVRGGEVRRPREVDPAVSRALEAVCLRALALSPEGRYPSAGRLAAEIEHYLADEPVDALPETRWRRAGRWVRRHTAAVRVAAVALAAVTFGAVAAAVIVADIAGREADAKRLAIEANRKSRQATAAEAKARDAAERALDAAEWVAYSGGAALAERAWRDGDVTSAWDHLRSCRRDFRDWEYAYLHQLFAGGRHVLRGHSGTTYVAVRPDGGAVATGDAAGVVRVWNAAEGLERRRLNGHSAAVRSIAFLPGDRLVTTADDAEVRIWELATGQTSRVLTGHSGPVTGIAVTADGRRMATAAADKTVRLWDLEGSADPLVVSGFEGEVLKLDFSPDGHLLAGAGLDGKGRVIDAADGRTLTEYSGHGEMVVSVAFHPDGQHVATGGITGSLRIWDAHDGVETANLPHPPVPVWAMCFRPDGGELASGSGDGILRIWEPGTGRIPRRYQGHSLPVSSIAYTGDGRRVVAGSADGTASVWNVDREQGETRLTGHTAGVTAVSLSDAGDRAATSGFDGTVRLWDVRAGRQIREFACSQKNVFGTAISPDGRLVAAASGTYLEVWDADSGERRFPPIPSHTERPGSQNFLLVAFTPDGRRLACGRSDGEIEIRTVADPSNCTVLAGHSALVSAVAFDPEGRLLASGSHDKTVRLWDASSGETVAVISGQEEEITSLAFSPDGRWLASGGGHPPNPRTPGSIRVWDVASGRAVVTMLGHSGTVTGVAFSPTGRRVLSTSTDRTLRFWNSTTGREVFALKDENPLTRIATGRSVESVACVVSPEPSPASAGALRLLSADLSSYGAGEFSFRGHASGVHGLSLSPDGRVLTSGSAEGFLKRWDVVTGKELFVGKVGLAGIYRLEYDDDGRRLVGFGPNGIKVWDERTGREEASFPLTGVVGGLDISGARIVASHRDPPRLMLFDTRTGSTVWTAADLDSPPLCVRFALGGSLVVTGHADGTVRCSDARNGELRERTQLGAGPVNDVALHPGDRLLAAACGDDGGGRVQILSVPALEAGRTIGADAGAALALVFSQEGLQIASGGIDGAVRVWDTQTGELRRVHRGPNSGLHRLVTATDVGMFFGSTTGGPSHREFPGEIWSWRWDASQ